MYSFATWHICHLPHCAGYISAHTDSQVAILCMGADVPFSVNQAVLPKFLRAGKADENVFSIKAFKAKNMV